MLTRPAVRRSLLPLLFILGLLLFSFVVSSRGTFPFNGKLVACTGYGSGYGYTGGPPSVTGINPTGARLPAGRLSRSLVRDSAASQERPLLSVASLQPALSSLTTHRQLRSARLTQPAQWMSR